MKILVVSHTAAPLGGMETFLRGILPALRARGHAVGMIYDRAYGVPEAAGEPSWNMEALGVEPALAGARQWQPDLVWVHALHDAGTQARAASLAPSVLHAHAFLATCATGSRLQSRPHPHACGRTLGPRCLLENYFHGCGLRNPIQLATAYRTQVRRRDGLAQFDRIIACSRYGALELERNGAAHNRLHWLHYPLWQAPGPEPRPRPEAAEPPSRLLCLARLVPEKGLHVLLPALAGAQAALKRPLSLVVGGNGPEQPRLQALARRLVLDVTWRGWMDAIERNAALAAADLLVLPSIWPEPFGIVGQEAEAVAMPAVAFSVGGIPEWLLAGENGELAPADRLDAAGFQAALLRALSSHTHFDRLRLGAWRGAARFALPLFLDRLEAIFDQAQSQSRRRT